MIKVPELTKELADEIALTAKVQLKVSRDYKMPRMTQVKESEDLYLGVVEKQLKNPFNYAIPFMPGFVDHYLSKIDDPPKIEFEHTNEADLKLSRKVTSAFDKEVSSTLPRAKWALKDRWCKKMAIFSGVGVYKYFADQSEDNQGHLKYQSNFSSKDHYTFHCEPAGGGILEDHLFCGEEDVFKTRQELADGAKEGVYDAEQVAMLCSKTGQEQHKENQDEYDEKNNRYRALGLDPVTNNYTGQPVYKLVEWYLTYEGVRWYVLFDDHTGAWVRVKPLREIFSSDLYPYVTWHTNEDPRVFWTKAPCDDARSVAKYINKALNQELYNREKQNRGQRAYDAQMFHDVDALADWRPDGLVPVDTKNGTRSVASGLYTFNIAGLNGTIDLVQFLDSYTGQKTGSTPASQGAAEKDKKVGIFYGEMQQVDQFIGTKNKSYTEAWAEIGLRFIYGLDDNLTDEGIEVQLMGNSGIEWSTLTKKDMKRNRELSIKVKGGSDEAAKGEMTKKNKLEGLKGVQTANPRWKDEQMLRLTGWTDEEIKRAFSMLPYATEELLSEAAQSIQDILEGQTPKLNRGANAAFMQKIIDFSTELSLDNKKKENELANKLYDYALAHAGIAAENEARDALRIVRERNASKAELNKEIAPEEEKPTLPTEPVLPPKPAMGQMPDMGQPSPVELQASVAA